MFQVDTRASAYTDTLLVGAGGTATSMPPGVEVCAGMPASIPRSQFYFWTALWQAGERDAEADYRTGRVHRFDDPTDAIRWLLSNDT